VLAAVWTVAAFAWLLVIVPALYFIGLNIKKKPVSATNAIAAALLYGLSFAL